MMKAIYLDYNARILLASMIFILVYGKFHQAVKRSRMAGLAEKAA